MSSGPGFGENGIKAGYRAGTSKVKDCLGARDRAQQFRVLFQRSRDQILVPTPESSWLPIAPAPGDPAPFSNLHERPYAHTYTQTYVHTHKNKREKKIVP